MYSKAGIFNLALGALLLSKRIVNTESDTSNECRVLNLHWLAALNGALEEMDLDATATPGITLELIAEDPNDYWSFVYKYPTNCAFVRRIESGEIRDNRSSRIPLRIGIYDGKKGIFTNLADATAEIVTNDIPLTHLSSAAVMTIAYKLAILCAPLATGKGARELIKTLKQDYLLHKMTAQDLDRRENMTFYAPEEESEFVETRLE